MGILCSEWITAVIKYKLKISKLLWNARAVTEEWLQNSSSGKISVSFRVKGNKRIVPFFGVCAFVLSASELMKCSSYYIITCNCYSLRLSPFFTSCGIYFLFIFPRKLSENCKTKPKDFMLL